MRDGVNEFLSGGDTLKSFCYALAPHNGHWFAFSEEVFEPNELTLLCTNWSSLGTQPWNGFPDTISAKKRFSEQPR
jgi:hypothetical protein